MTKSIKKIFAALLVVATLALMIPFSASAAGTAGNYELTLKISGDKAQEKAEAFSFKIYRLADIDTATGEVTYKVTGEAKTKAQEAVDSAKSAELLNYCDGLATAPGEATSYAWIPAKGEDGQFETSNTIEITEAGIYYVRSQGSGTRAQGAIVTLPLANNGAYENSYEADLAEKINPSAVDVDKKITAVNGVNTNVKADGEVASASVDDDVKFELKATVPGQDSVGSKLKDYEIVDKMTATELKFNNDAKVYVSDAQGKNFTEITDYTVTTPSDATFGIKLDTTNGYINPNYYGKTIKVEFTAKVLAGAKVYTDGSNDNTDYLKYTNEAGKDYKVDGNTVQVFTFNVGVLKYETNTTTALPGAEFALYKTEADANAKTNEVASGVTDTHGKIAFDAKLAEGTYYVRELEAPKGYVLDSTAKAVKISAKYDATTSAGTYTATVANADNGVVYLTAYNTKITVPSTGGMGTTIFTVCGASLIVLAGVMFVVLKRKKTSK